MLSSYLCLVQNLILTGKARGLLRRLYSATFAPGEAYQFDWSHETVVMNGVTMVVKAAHMRLLGEGAGREPGGPDLRTLLHAKSAGQEL